MNPFTIFMRMRTLDSSAGQPREAAVSLAIRKKGRGQDWREIGENGRRCRGSAVLRGMVLSALAIILVFSQAPRALASGACTCARFHDWQSLGCALTLGGNQTVCPDCPSPSPDGIPRWRVEEPYINLFITDQPLSYFMSSGERMTFRWYYKQRYQLPQPDECPNLYNIAGNKNTPRPIEDTYLYYQRAQGMTNGGWGHNWLMDVMFWDQPWEVEMVAWQGQWPYMPFTREYEALVFRPEGGIYYFNCSQPGTSTFTDPLTQVTLQPQSGLGYPIVSLFGQFSTNPPIQDANGIYWDNPGTGFVMTYADGSQDVFGLAVLNWWQLQEAQQMDDSTSHAFLTKRIDPQGRTTWLGYEMTNYAQLQYNLHVRYVVDPDGHTNTFWYNAPNPNPFQVAAITNFYGGSAQFGYGGNSFTNGLLTSITDAVGNQSTFGYQATSGWITNLTTPNGTTTFTHYQNPDPSQTNGFSQRALLVTEFGAAYQLFYYTHTNGLPATATSPANVPGNSFDDGTWGSDGHRALSFRNTFHWDERQFGSISSGAFQYLTNRVNPNGLSTGLGLLSTNDLLKAGLKHWLWQPDAQSISQCLSSEGAASPDAAGLITGPRTWYNYANKPDSDIEGDPHITCAARSLPDTSSQYAIYTYGGSTHPSSPWAGLVLASRTSCTLPNGAQGELTNNFNYAANGIDLTNVNNSIGQTATLTYNTHHQVLGVTNALNQVTAVGWDSTSHNLTNVSLPSGETVGLTYKGLLQK